MEHVGRLGGTPYVADAWELELDPAAGSASPRCTPLRRDALEALDAARLAPWTSRGRRDPSALAARAAGAPPRPRPSSSRPSSSLEAAEACLAAGADRVLLPSPARRRAVDAAAGVEPLLPRVAHDDELPRAARVGAGAGRASRREPRSARRARESGVARRRPTGGSTRVNPLDGRGAARLGAGLRVGVAGAVRAPARRAGRGVAGARRRARVRPAGADGGGALRASRRGSACDRRCARARGGGDAGAARPEGLRVPGDDRRRGTHATLQRGDARPVASVARAARRAASRRCGSSWSRRRPRRRPRRRARGAACSSDAAAGAGARETPSSSPRRAGTSTAGCAEGSACSVHAIVRSADA